MKATRLHPIAATESTASASPATRAADAVWACRFDVPGLPRHHVHRQRALELLSRTDDVPLVVVTAPPGTGKTTLLAEWVKAEGRSGDTAWVTFDGPPDVLAQRGVFAACLGRCLADLGVDVAPGHDDRPSAAWVSSPASAVVAAGRRLTIVLDDHHRLTADVADDVDLLLRLTRGRLRLVFAGRRPPALPLHRYRLENTLVELGSGDLAFDDGEAATLLATPGEPPQPTAGVHDWNAYHGGWVAGLVLSRRSWHVGRPGGTAESDVDDYFRHEVFDPLPVELRRFLLGTCVVDAFDDELARELAGPAADRLVRLAECSAFATTTRTGDHAYPGVVRDALRRELERGAPRQVSAVRLPAAAWLRRRGALERALLEYAAAEAWDEVAGLLIDGQLVSRLLCEGDERFAGPLRRACEPLAGSENRAAPVVRAALRLADGDALGCAQTLSSVPEDADPALRACVTALDAVRARLTADADGALASAEAAQRDLGGTGAFHPAGTLPALVRVARGVALLRHGDFDLARAVLEDTAARPDGRTLAAVHADCLAHLALTDAVEGYLTRAEHTATESLTALTRHTSPFDGHAAAHIALALVALDRCDPGTAWSHATTAEPAPEPLTRHLAHRITAGVEAAEGHPAAAASRLHAALTEAAPTDPWAADHLRVEAARLALVEGHPDLALHELGSLGRVDGAPAPAAHPDAAAVRAAAHLRRNEDSRAQQILATVADGSVALRPRVAALLVETERRLRHRSPLRSAPVLDTALRLAAPERLRLPFRQAGPDVRHVLATDPRGTQYWLGRLAETPPTPPVEALTAREREVLRHLTDLLTTEEIAEAMVVSVNTVRTHVRGILRKLGVNRRYAAVRRARELGLLDD
ncbi:LuxR C-terminal-related transcriptional regulator [Saccharomonospora azurea]